MGLIVLTGGARSGKSTLAGELAEATGDPVCYIATAEARDDEMTRRIDNHRRDRPASWLTIEEPYDLVGALEALPEEAVAIVDCLTLWVANMLERSPTDEEIVEIAEDAARRAATRPQPVIAVTNEVGSGIVPMNDLARRYRDVLGVVNGRWCHHAQGSFLVVAGRALALSKPSDVFETLR